MSGSAGVSREGLGLERMLHWARLCADGIPLHDVQQAAATISDRAQWVGFWQHKGDQYASLGQQALDEGNEFSAGEWLFLASLSYHYGQFRWFHDPGSKEAMQHRKVELYNRAAPHFKPPARRIEVPFEGHIIPGFLRLPGGVPPRNGWPCVVLVGGLESTKEESYRLENLFLDRGLATFAFDGPGQGEFFFEVKLQPDFDRYASAAVDQLVREEYVDPARLGVLGRSLGGHYAIRCAAQDERFRACVSWGGSWSEEAWLELPEGELLAWLYVAGFTNDREAGLLYLQEALSLADVAAKLRVPTLAILGEVGDTGRPHHLDTHISDFPNTKIELEILPGCEHCCHDLSHLIRPQMADWLARRLAAER